MSPNTSTVHPRRPRFLATGLTAVALVGAVALGGCGDDDEDQPVGTDVIVGTTMVTATTMPTGATMPSSTMPSGTMPGSTMTSEVMTTEPTVTTGG